MIKHIKLVLLLIAISTSAQAQYMNITFCSATDEVSPVNDGNGNDQRHKGAMILDFIKLKRFGGSTAPIIYQLSKEVGDPTFDNGTYLDNCTNNNNNTNCGGCGICLPPKVNGSNTGTISTKYEKSVRVRGMNGNLQFESTGKFNQVCYTTKNIDLSNYKQNSMSIEVGWEGTEQDGFATKNVLIYYSYNGGVKKWSKIVNSPSAVLGVHTASLSKTEPVPTSGGNGGGCTSAFNFQIDDFNDQTTGIQFPVKLVSDNGGAPTYNITYKNGSYDYNCEFTLPNNTTEYYLEPKYNEDAVDKVSTRDLVVILNQLLAKKTFTKQEMKIAADVNNSGTISTSDISETRKVILGKLISFRKVESYRFWNADQDFSGNTDPLTVPPIQQRIRLSDVLNKTVSGDFNVVKMGDLTTIQSAQGIETRTKNTVELTTNNIYLNKNETKDIYFQLNSENVNSICAIQGALSSPNNACDISSIEWADIDGFYSYSKANNDMRFLWYSDNGIKIENAPLLKIQLTVRENIYLKDALAWNNDILAGKFTDKSIREGNLSLRIENNDNRGLNNDIIISPNPVQNGLLQFTFNQAKIISQIRTISSTGKILTCSKNKDFKINNGKVSLLLNSSITSGCYLLIVDYEDNTFSSSKFVANHN